MTTHQVAAPASRAQAAPTVLLQRSSACGRHAEGGDCAECKEEHVGLLQRAATGREPVGAVPPIVHDALRSPGQPLDDTTRAIMEPRFGRDFSQVPVHRPSLGVPQAQLTIGQPGDRFEREAERAADDARSGAPLRAAPLRAGADFSHVRIHTDGAAYASARAVGARAYTVGEQIVFGAGQYDPQTAAGRHLLAHELAHVAQQRGALAGSVLRRAPGEQTAPARVGLSVSISGLLFDVPPDITYKRGSKRPQLLAIILQRLVGPHYPPALEREVEAELSKGTYKRAGGFAERQPAKGGEPIERIDLDIIATSGLLNVLKAKKLEVQLTPQQEELLTLGRFTLFLSADVLRTLREGGNPLPAWYSRAIFDREIARHGALLREYADRLTKARAGDEAARISGQATINEVIEAIYKPAMVLEAVRRQVSLAADPETAGIYGVLWELPAAQKGQAPKLVAPPRRLRSISDAVLFLGYMRTQPDLTKFAEEDEVVRTELVKRFARYTQQMLFAGTGAGDEELRDRPATANYPAFPSTLEGIPQLPSPLFDTPLDTDHRFRMEVQFPSVYEALGVYSFSWERVRIPDDKIGQPVDLDKLKGEKATLREVAAIRFSRDTAYAVADISRVVDEMRSDLGPPGVGALELVGANAILRYVGTGIRLALETLTMPLDQKIVAFPSTGLYMVRAKMSQVREGKEAVVRAPSVAYFPVLVRDPEEMAAGGVKAALTARERAAQRIQELEATLGEPDLKDEERKQAQQELEALRLATAPLGGRLEHRRAELEKQIAGIKGGTVEGDLEAATKERERTEKLIALRAKRKAGDGEVLTARFVSDLGQTIPLTLEVVDRPAPKRGGATVYVSDTTTPKSGDETGSGKTRDDAIADGVRRLLESIHGYGRGRAALALGGGVRTIRIEASLGSLLSESIENVATVLSVAAIAAAPFTGGASLAYLVPLGLVGAIPSAYRVLSHVEAGTFELDLDTALEIVNIAGSLIGLGSMGATSLRMMRLGKGLLIVGIGIDSAGGLMMGANFLAQIDALAKLPPGERSAALLLLIGQTMMSTGVMVGGALAERAQHRRAEVEGGKMKGLVEEKPPTIAGEPAKAPGETPAGGKPAAAGGEALDRARVDGELTRLGGMDGDSEARLRADDPLRKALTDQPLAAAALKKCASPCFPPGVTPEQVARLDRLLSRLAETGNYDQAALKKYLYDRRATLDTAIAQIEGVRTGGDLSAYLKFFNEGGEVTKLPPKGDPRQLMEQRDRAHDYGVERGRALAMEEGKESVAFVNPFERQGRYGQGFDDVMKKGPTLDTGEVYIIEYKGGDAGLSPGQMELEWVIGNIRRLYTQGGPSGQAWARTLAKALREGRLKGAAYSTPVVNGSPKQTTLIKPPWDYPATSLSLP